MDSCNDLKPGGSGILPEETAPKFFSRHLSAYHFAFPYVKGRDVLEIGFGDGYGADFLTGYANTVKAVDALEKNVTLARAKYKRNNLEFIKMDASGLSFNSGSFDIVVSFQVIEHITEHLLVQYLEGIKRVLKERGLAFISTLNLDKNKKPNRPYTKNPFHAKEFTFKEFDSLIKSIFHRYEIYGLFYGKKLRIYECLKKLGIFKHLPSSFNIVDKYYSNITLKDFIWSKDNLDRCIDFMAKCNK
jgi:2-polyprenyl-3-methyl-5-hydroxy-6-metoxy-1,4-benzoquinol methylase